MDKFVILVVIPQVAPDWRQASSLKKAIEDKITKGNFNSSVMTILPAWIAFSKNWFAHLILEIQCRWSNWYWYCCNCCWTSCWWRCSSSVGCSQEVKRWQQCNTRAICPKYCPGFDLKSLVKFECVTWWYSLFYIGFLNMLEWKLHVQM